MNAHRTPPDDNPEAAVADLAAAVDRLLGRDNPETTTVEDLDVSTLVPESVRTSPQLGTVNRGVASASVGLTVVVLVFGNGGLSAVVASISVAAKNSPTVGSYLNFAQAFMLTLPLSVLVTATVWLTLAGKVKSYGALFVLVLGGLAITYVAGQAGIDGPALDQVLASMTAAGSNPIAKALGMLGAYASYYTVVPFLGGVIAGVATGWIGFRLATPQS